MTFLKQTHRSIKTKMQQIIANIMTIGVIIAISLMLIGEISYLIMHYNVPRPNAHIFHGEPKDLENLYDLIKSVFSGNLKAVIQLGIFLLLINPLVRVFVVGLSFKLQKNKLYAWISLFVFCALLISFIG